MSKIIIKYALDLSTGEMAFIDNAKREFHKCQKCHNVLIPVKGEARKKEWHFRHQIDSECSGGQETFIHNFAKQVIVSKSKITIPNYGVINYTGAIAEKQLISIRPDVIALYNGEEIFFEIAVKHFIEPEKNSFLINGQHRSIEIDLSALPLSSSPKEIENAVINGIRNKRIIFWKTPPKIVYQPEKDKKKRWYYFVSIAFGILLLLNGFNSLTRKKRH